LEILDLWNQLGQMTSAPINSINLFADKRRQLVSRTIILRDESGSNAAALPLRTQCLFIILSSLFTTLPPCLVCCLDEIDFSSLQLHHSLVALLHQLLNFLGVAVDPNARDIIEDSEQGSLVETILWDASNKNGSRRDSAAVKWREQVSLLQSRKKDQFSVDGEENKREKDNADKNVSIVAILVCVRDVGEGENIQSALTVTAS